MSLNRGARPGEIGTAAFNLQKTSLGPETG